MSIVILPVVVLPMIIVGGAVAYWFFQNGGSIK